MLHRPISRALLAGAALMILPGPAPADTIYDTVYIPTSSVVGVPGPSILSTSYALPTSYVVPTSFSSTYLPTSAVYTSDSVLIPTSTTYYRRSLLRPRRYVERTSYTSYLSPTTTILPTSYLSTSYVLPTSYLLPTTYVSSSRIVPTSYVIDNGVVATSDPCEVAPSAPTAKTSASRSSGGNSGDGSSIISQPSDGGTERKPTGTTMSDDGIPPPATPPAPGPVVSTVPTKPVNAATGNLAEPPVVGDTDKAKAATQGGGGNTNGAVQVPPAGTLGPDPKEMMYRNARRPAYDVRNILRGRVISAESKLPEEGVTVILSSVTKAFIDKPAMTDADGEFKVSLPDGDWTVKVKMNSGSIFTVGQNYVTASGGRVVDASGRTVTEFLIKR